MFHRIADRAGQDGSSSHPSGAGQDGFRPVFLLKMRDLPDFWGRETAESAAKEDLVSKLRQIDPANFVGVAFMLCYAVNGSKIRFCVIGDPGSKNGIDF